MNEWEWSKVCVRETEGIGGAISAVVSIIGAALLWSIATDTEEYFIWSHWAKYTHARARTYIHLLFCSAKHQPQPSHFFLSKTLFLQFSCTLPPSDLLSSPSWYRSLSLWEPVCSSTTSHLYLLCQHAYCIGWCVCLSVLRSVWECVCASAFVCHCVASLHVFTDACDSWRQMCECEVINIIKLTAQHFAQFTQAMKTKAKQTQPLIFISWAWAY